MFTLAIMSYTEITDADLKQIDDEELLENYSGLIHKLDYQKKMMDETLSELKHTGDKIKEIKKKRNFEVFVETIRTSECMICRVPLFDSAGTSQMAFTSYICACSKQRIIHVGCLSKRNFLCVCGEKTRMDMKDPSGRKVDITLRIHSNSDTERNENIYSNSTRRPRSNSLFSFSSSSDSD